VGLWLTVLLLAFFKGSINKFILSSSNSIIGWDGGRVGNGGKLCGFGVSMYFYEKD